MENFFELDEVSKKTKSQKNVLQFWIRFCFIPDKSYCYRYIYIFTFIVKMPRISLFYVTEPKN